MNNSVKEEIALFRYDLIYPLLNETYVENTKKEYLDNLAANELTFPNGKKGYVQPGTVKAWAYDYRRFGFEGLKPKGRSDKGNSRSLTNEQKDEIIRLKLENPRRTGTAIRRTMINSGFFINGIVSETTVQRYLAKMKPTLKLGTNEDMRRFEMAHVNELWQIDTSHGPFINVNGKKTKVYIVAIVDDASRFVVGHDLYFEDNALNVQETFKKAILTYGVPKRLYADNGKPYKNKQLRLICASLGVGLNHAAPYHGNQKGKVERLFGVLKTNWMYNLDYSQFDTIEQLKRSLDTYISEKNQTYNRSIDKSPFERFTEDGDYIKKIDKRVLDRAFLHTVERKVANDGTVSINTRIFEVGYVSIGQWITVKYQPDFSVVYAVVDDKLKGIKEVNPVENAKIRRKNVRLTEDDE
jgi:transposase InsO family protein